MKGTPVPEGAAVQEAKTQIASMRTAYDTLKQVAGLDHAAVLNTAFDLYGLLIKSYELTACDELLREIDATCRQRPAEEPFFVKLVQAFAFLRFKQFRFAEAVEYFEEMRSIVGPNAFLLENTGHAYNSMGDQASAARCFSEALDLIAEAQKKRWEEMVAEDASAADTDVNSVDVPEAANKGGLLMGLGLVKSRTDEPEEALVLLQDAKEFYSRRLRVTDKGDDAVLVAKAAVSVAAALEQLDRLDEAAVNYEMAVGTFSRECGLASPLTTDALRKLGFLRADQEKWKEAECLLSSSLALGVEVDAFSVNVYSLSNLVIRLFQVHIALGVYERKASWYVPLISKGLAKVRQQNNSQALASPEFAVLAKLLEELKEIEKNYKDLSGEADSEEDESANTSTKEEETEEQRKEREVESAVEAVAAVCVNAPGQ